MPTTTVIFLIVRALHVLFGAIVVGAAAFVTLVQNRAAAGDAPAAARPVRAFIQMVGGIAVITGIWLYWEFTGHFDPAVSRSMAARVFGAGGVAGLAALITAAVIARRNPAKSAGGTVTLLLLVIAVLCMAVGHYF